MRLVAFGCSYTQGVGLESDIGATSTRTSKYAWPQLVADNLGIECVNKGLGGISVKRTAYEILNFDFKKNDIVCIFWPDFNRHGIIQDDGSFMDISPSGGAPIEDVDTYYTKFHTKLDSIWNYFSTVENITHFLHGKSPSVIYQMSVSEDVVYSTVGRIQEVFFYPEIEEKFGTGYFGEVVLPNTKIYFPAQFRLFPAIKTVDVGFTAINLIKNKEIKPLVTELVADGHLGHIHHKLLAHRITTKSLSALHKDVLNPNPEGVDINAFIKNY